MTDLDVRELWKVKDHRNLERHREQHCFGSQEGKLTTEKEKVNERNEIR